MGAHKCSVKKPREWRRWCAMLGLNQRLLPCRGSALPTELTVGNQRFISVFSNIAFWFANQSLTKIFKELANPIPSGNNFTDQFENKARSSLDTSIGILIKLKKEHKSLINNSLRLFVCRRGGGVCDWVQDNLKKGKIACVKNVKKTTLETQIWWKWFSIHPLHRLTFFAEAGSKKICPAKPS